jgi:tetratricopeptide (TPR) repeat protein
MRSITQRRELILVALLLLVSAGSSAAQTDDPQLVQLRRQLALRYMEPGSHLQLAKYYLQKGDRLQAFHIMEYARRTFLEAQFNQAFQTHFGGPRSTTLSKPAEALLNKARELDQAGDTKKAEDYFAKAAEQSPGSVEVQTWVGRYFFKNRRDNLRALPFYLNAYFLNPHAYETEFVESRIRTINYEEATIRYRQLAQKDASLEEILKEPNPTVIVLALEQIVENWRPAYLQPVLSAMAHDDEQVRWLCTEALQKHVDQSFDEDLKVLLQHRDLRIRGLAAYVAAHLWKERSFDLLRNMLNDEAQLLRFDAISSLSRDGGNEGRKILIAHRRRETNPGLRRLIDKELAAP